MDIIEWILLVTDHYEESRAFYRDILELPIEREVPEDHFTQFRLRNCFLAIYGKKEIQTLLDANEIVTGGGAIYSFAQVDDVEQACRQLKAKGVQFIKEPTRQPWGQITAYFTDPDGHIWEIQKWER